ncbi:FCD domain-containing protein [Streptomyces globisporus]|uniref:Lactate-responsive regulator LldR in Actinobacteria, GntR family n=2 Tax=Streptomyces globisporus TaxID=1908 RepID=A0ABN8V0A2_STRGL|nr:MULTISPECIES: FCD domain-containing protein [Streptomyces]RDL07341.1 DNA-binding FadR family transcriptional regulator [Streptomyces sp. HB202]UIZ16689.1 FCD domain-containing protein [Streptomyces sp. R527F]WSQ90376.1 FCD domain-containing protein [Streptomyces globisporus]WSU79676.1 FCD domain-containing protein [Streptomyces globisporus]WSV88351.1 FCD domain-containing protein [Streptomyces globisporus]
MPVEWQPVQQSRTHELVLRSIEERVFAGELRAGDRLPPERELAPVLGVSRSALREALRVLETIGVLVAQPGRGPDAGARIVRNPDDALGRLLRLHFALGSYSLHDVLEARVVLERSSFEGAACHAPDEDLDEAEELVAGMAEPGIGVSAFNDLDTRFHVLIARSSGNALTSTLTSAVRESVRPLILRALEAAEDWPATARALNAEHRTLLTLVREGSGPEAADLVEWHIRGLHGTLVEGPTGPTGPTAP